jgi:hypothetical protein
VWMEWRVCVSVEVMGKDEDAMSSDLSGVNK